MTDTEQELRDAEHDDLCAACGGDGEVGTHQNYWGIWETEPCRACDGTGER